MCPRSAETPKGSGSPSPSSVGWARSWCEVSLHLLVAHVFSWDPQARGFLGLLWFSTCALTLHRAGKGLGKCRRAGGDSGFRDRGTPLALGTDESLRGSRAPRGPFKERMSARRPSQRGSLGVAAFQTRRVSAHGFQTSGASSSEVTTSPPAIAPTEIGTASGGCFITMEFSNTAGSQHHYFKILGNVIQGLSFCFPRKKPFEIFSASGNVYDLSSEQPAGRPSTRHSERGEPSVVSLPGTGTFARSPFSLGLCLGKKVPIQMSADNVAFEKASLIAVTESLVSLYQPRAGGGGGFCTHE